MRRPCATSAGPAATGAEAAIRPGGAIAEFLPHTGPVVQPACAAAAPAAAEHREGGP
jgi:hypothetical protein